jgi:hypothetical protein
MERGGVTICLLIDPVPVILTIMNMTKHKFYNTISKDTFIESVTPGLTTKSALQQAALVNDEIEALMFIYGDASWKVEPMLNKTQTTKKEKDDNLVLCQWCKKRVAKGTYKRWHGDLCKDNPQSPRYESKDKEKEGNNQ